MRLRTSEFVPGLLLAIGTCAACNAGEPAPAPPRVSVVTVGQDNVALEMFDAEIAQGKFNLVDHLLVVRCGEQVFERSYSHNYRALYGEEARKQGPLNPHGKGMYNYFDSHWHPYLNGSDLHTLQSVTKTLTSVVYGVAITRGDFKASLDTPVLRYFKESAVRNVDARKRRIRLRDLLTMSAGLDWNEELSYDDARNAAIGMEAANDWVQYVIDRPMAHEPGTVFAYNSGASELLAHIFLAETGQDIDRYAQKHLFEPLGITSHYWKRNPTGLVDTEGGLYLRAQDLAKIGLLYLHNGKWHGDQIVAAEWITQSLQPRFDAGAPWKYGYQWWLRPHESSTQFDVAARGFGGQLLFVSAQENLVLVLNGWTILGNGPADHEIIDQVLAAVRSPNCPTP